MYILLFIGWRGPCTKLFLKSPTTKHNIKTFLAKNSFRTEDRRRNKTIKSVFAAWIIYKLLWCQECDLSSLSRSSICCRCLVASKQKRSCGKNLRAKLVAPKNMKMLFQCTQSYMPHDQATVLSHLSNHMQWRRWRKRLCSVTQPSSPPLIITQIDAKCFVLNHFYQFI